MEDPINKMIHHIADWLSGSGNDSDVIISSRVRLARNLQDIPFIDRASEDQKQAVIGDIRNAVNDVALLERSAYIDMSGLQDLDQQFFMERRLISSEFVDLQGPRGFFISNDESISLMINEEDHLRLQIIESGLSLEKAWYMLHQLDQKMSLHLKYAYSDHFGYLTACPTNVGTGIRFSVFIHLPVLTFTKKIETMFAEMIPAGIAIRGFYGEGSKVMGNFFQISNQYTLGWTEQGILDRIIPLIKRFIFEERKAREQALKTQRIHLEDKIYRDLGILTHARILPSIEFLNHLSALRMGVDLGFLPNIDRKVFNELIVFTQPAHIQKWKGKSLTELEIDTIRASLVRDKLNLHAA
ncbi:protein arginine kinase [bacterium]